MIYRIMIYMDSSEKCLVCGDTKMESAQRCKMCGTGMKAEHRYNGFSFCSIKCRDIFSRLMEMPGEKERRELAEKEIIM